MSLACPLNIPAVNCLEKGNFLDRAQGTSEDQNNARDLSPSNSGGHINFSPYA